MGLPLSTATPLNMGIGPFTRAQSDEVAHLGGFDLGFSNQNSPRRVSVVEEFPAASFSRYRIPRSPPGQSGELQKSI